MMQTENKHLNICFVSHTIYPLLQPKSTDEFIGGAELQQLMIGKELANRGHRVTYVTAKHGHKKRETIGPFQISFSFDPDEGIPFLKFFYPRLIRIWQALDRANANLFYVRSAGYILALVVAFAKIRKKNVIYCCASDVDFDPKKLKLPVPIRDKWLFYWGLKHCDAIIAQNKKQRGLLLKNFRIKPSVLYNGLPSTKGKNFEKDSILWVSTIKELKNPEIFMELAKTFSDQKFVMIGGDYRSRKIGKSRYFMYIKEKADQIPNLEFKGFLPFEEAYKWFDHAKLLINTSSYEGFPNTFLQAWSVGTPVIAFVDPDGLIKKHKIGITVKDMDEMVEAVRNVLKQNIEFSSSQIRKYFQNNHSIEILVDRYEKLIYGHYKALETAGETSPAIRVFSPK